MPEQDREFVDIDGPRVRAKRRSHESGREMIFFYPFRPARVSTEEVDRLFETARMSLQVEAKLIGVIVEAEQKEERSLLETMGFRADGFEYVMSRRNLPFGRGGLGSRFEVRRMDYDQDIESVVALERRVHAADPSSRVNFDTHEAVASMKDYYKRALEEMGVYVLFEGSRMAGLMGLLPDRERPTALHVSSVSFDLDYQGQGLFFPFLKNVVDRFPEGDFDRISGMTTTKRLLSAAQRYGAQLTSVSMLLESGAGVSQGND